MFSVTVNPVQISVVAQPNTVMIVVVPAPSMTSPNGCTPTYVVIQDSGLVHQYRETPCGSRSRPPNIEGLTWSTSDFVPIWGRTEFLL
jgi:hypothetical protein